MIFRKSAHTLCWLVLLPGCAQPPDSVLAVNPDSVPPAHESLPSLGYSRAGPAPLQSLPLPGQTKDATAGTFAFKPAGQYQSIIERSSEYFTNVWITDVNGDGRSDVVSNGSTYATKTYVLLQKEDGSLASPLLYMSASVFEVKDFNEDGVDDILFLDTESYSSDYLYKYGMLVSDGSGGLKRIFSYSDYSSHAGNAQTTLDVDGDGHQDLVVTYAVRVDGGGTCGHEVGHRDCSGYRVLYGDGSAKFTRVEEFQTGSRRSIHELHSIDLNDDGRKDLVVATAGTHPTFDPIGNVMVAYALPAGELSALTILHPSYGAHGYLAFADVTGDGLTDSIITPTDQQWKPEIRARQLDNTFVPWTTLWANPLLPGLILADDFDGDRRADLVSIQILNGGMGLGYYRQSAGALLAPVYTTLPQLWGTPPFGNHSLAAGDFNGDGCNDVVFASGSTGLLFFAGSNCTPSPRTIPNESGYGIRRQPPGG